ncbi:hypothetical protein [Serratia marcescens]|uniref:hypothetical protein n=1 Tax=Serratia marcescens TaxID=615 RepID=UPI0025AAD488|nr:hypothetical protein [Serratia marcescens]MDN0031247.1 hypothetical protein [Serratia marcescens]
MDNKLSELTYFMLERFSMNPVSSKIVGEEWRKTFPDEYAVAKVIRALLAELEAKDKRIAELEAEITNIVDSHAETVAELRAKLATPVRLPDRHSALFRRYLRIRSDYQSHPAFKADEVIAAIQAAGFTVEGDE